MPNTMAGQGSGANGLGGGCREVHGAQPQMRLGKQVAGVAKSSSLVCLPHGVRHLLNELTNSIWPAPHCLLQSQQNSPRQVYSRRTHRPTLDLCKLWPTRFLRCENDSYGPGLIVLPGLLRHRHIIPAGCPVEAALWPEESC